MSEEPEDVFSVMKKSAIINNQIKAQKTGINSIRFAITNFCQYSVESGNFTGERERQKKAQDAQKPQFTASRAHKL